MNAQITDLKVSFIKIIQWFASNFGFIFRADDFLTHILTNQAPAVVETLFWVKYIICALVW